MIGNINMYLSYILELYVFVLFLIQHSDGNMDEVYQAHCRNSLGMNSGEIPNNAITSSSSYDPSSVGPQNARIRKESNGGAWCPSRQIDDNVYEWLQIDLGSYKQVTLVETQGRFGNGQGQEFAEEYRLEYQRENETEWVRFLDHKDVEIFAGNTNTYIAELRELRPPIIARKVRIVPTSSHRRTVCMRIELYGCTLPDGVIAYEMPQGDRRGSEVDLFDFTYDGIIYNNYLSNGLGQLTDGETGDSNFRLDPFGTGKKGYEWVGWKNDTNREPIDIIFEFNNIRNFSSCSIHGNNMFEKDVRIFRTAHVYFSIDGSTYFPEPEVFLFTRDMLIEYSRNVVIPIHHKIGRFVKLRLWFDDKWLLISEVSFKSEIVKGNISNLFNIGHKKKNGNSIGVMHHPNNKGSHILQVNLIPDFSIPNIRNDIRTKPVNTTQQTMSKTQSREKPEANEEFIGIIVGALSACLLVFIVIIIVIIIRHKRRKNGTHSSRGYAVPDVTKSSLLQPQHVPYFGNVYPEANVPLNHPTSNSNTICSAYTATNFASLQGVTGNNVYAVPNGDLLWKEDLSVIEFPRDQLKFIEKLGEGQFGEVNLCEALHINNLLGDDFLINRGDSSRSLLVAVKTLRTNADKHARDDFHKEVQIMSKLRDPNIVRVLGVITNDEPYCALVEYMKYGDLYQFLKQHSSEDTLSRKHKYTLSYGCLIYMATQIASGMKYLESLNMVHRDLATRNCLVGSCFKIKISDFGMSRNLYSADYYRIEGKAMLPIRWMAWESVLLGKFSCKSDVWSFAVTLWEILNFAVKQPFDELSDEQVIDNCGRYYRNDNLEISLSPPYNCTKEVFDLMKECWNREEIHRPAFREIHMFLQVKNKGYNPNDEQGTYVNSNMKLTLAVV